MYSEREAVHSTTDFFFFCTLLIYFMFICCEHCQNAKRRKVVHSLHYAYSSKFQWSFYLLSRAVVCVPCRINVRLNVVLFLKRCLLKIKLWLRSVRKQLIHTRISMYRIKNSREYCDCKRHNIHMCWIRLMICVEIMFMTFRQQTNLKHKIVFSQSCDLNYSTKWSRVSQQNYKVSFTGMPTTAVFFFFAKNIEEFSPKKIQENGPVGRRRK